MNTTITIKGTHCNACKVLIEEVAQDLPGVQSCEVNPQTGETHIEYDESLDWNALKQEIEGINPNYKVQL